MARNKKVEILSNDKEVLHPMTDGDCVIFEDGQTLTQKLSEDDSVKYTPEIVNSSPMFKVGEGNTVDYSDNVLDGAYERATLQGQTYVNYIQESSADEITLPTPFTEYERTQHNTLTSNEEGTLGINLVGQSYVNALQHDSEEEYVVLGESLEFQEKKVEYTNEGQIKSAMLKGQTLVNIFKSFANYTYSASEMGVKWLIAGSAPLTETLNNDELTMTLTGVGSKVVRIDDVSMLKPNTKYMVKINYTTSFENGINFGWLNNSTIYTQIASMKSNEYAIFTTPSDLSTWVGLWFGILSDLQIGDVIKISKPVLFEYQEGMENWDIPYFEGMQSVTVSTKLENKLGTCTATLSTNPKNGKTLTTNDGNTRSIYLINNSTQLGLKPNTKYIVGFKVSNLVLDGLSTVTLMLNVDSTNRLFEHPNGNGSTIYIDKNGVYRFVTKTTDNIESTALIKGIATEWENSGSSLRSMTISEIMYVEYQNGMENWTLPYFEDYQVMQPVQVESINKNLASVNTFQLTSKTDSSTGSATLNQVIEVNIPLNPSLEYVFTSDNTHITALCTNEPIPHSVYQHGHNNCYSHAMTTGGEQYKHPNNLVSGYKYITITTGGATSNYEVGQTVTFNNIQLEESDTATEYVPHQSKTTYSWDEVILRKVGDVEDTLDLTTGEWVQRIGEIVLDGSDDENWDTNGSYPNGSIVYMCQNYTNARTSTILIQSDKLSTFEIVDNNETMEDKPERFFTRVSGTGKIQFISKTTFGSFVELRQWLQSNPLKVQYELATPIVHKINLSRPNLQVYDDITHVHTKCLDGTLIPNIYLPSDISYPAILEPGKAYNVSINHTQVNTDNPLTVNVGGTEITMTDNRMTLTTPATLANSNVSFTGKGNKIKESMLIKNSSLLTRDLPHFNGIGSVQLGKTIENLCESHVIGVGSAPTQTFRQDLDYVTITTTAVGSKVIASKIIKPLENGKKYFVYAPNNYPSTALPHVSFSKNHNGSISFTQELTQMIDKKYTIVSINQKDNLYDEVVVGFHGSLAIGTYTIKKPIICEYEPGMEDWDWESIGYFTGTKNIGNEFMRVRTRNLFDGKLAYGAINGENGQINSSSQRMNIVNPIKIEKGKHYTINLTESTGIYLVREGLFYKNVSYNSYVGRIPFAYTSECTFVAPDDGYLRFSILKRVDSSSGSETTAIESEIKLQVEESSTATTYTAHKHNGLYITKDQPINLTWEQGAIFFVVGDSWTNMTNNVNSMRIHTPLLDLKPNKTYRVSLGSNLYQYGIQLYDNSNNGAYDYGWQTGREFIFETTKDRHKVGIAVGKIDPTNSTPITPSEINHVRLEEVTDVVLRGIDDVYDELDITRGIYTQRIGEVVFNGNENLIWSNSHDGGALTDVTCFGVSYASMTLPLGVHNKAISNNFEHFYSRPNREHFYYEQKGNTWAICVFVENKKLDLSLSLNDAFKKYLSKNPLKIQYVLQTPIVHKVHIGNKNEANTEVTKPNDVFTLPTLYTEQTHIDMTNNGIMPKVQSRDYIAYPVSPMINRTYTLQHNLTGGVSNLTIDLLGRTQEITYQEPKSLIYSPTTMDAILHHELRISGKGKISKVMYIDGGYMDRDIPYIEGMKNAVNPIVKNIGKNFTSVEGGNTNFFIDRIIANKTYYLYTERSSDVYYNLICFEERNNKSHGAIIKANQNKNLVSFTSPFDGYLYFNGYSNVEVKNVTLSMKEPSNYEPYKENICYVDCGEIRLTPDMFEQGSVGAASVGSHYNSDKADSGYRIRTKELIKLEMGEQYVFLGNNDKYKYSARFYDTSGNKVSHNTTYDLSWKGTIPFTILNDAPMCAFFIAKMDDTKITVDDADFNFQLVKVSEIKQMRSLPNGVYDEIDLETGKYIQRVGEITFNGTENWIVGYAAWQNKYTYYNNGFVDLKTMKGDNGSGQAYYDAVRCPQLHRSYMSRLAATLIDGVCSYYYSGYQRIFISKQDCATVDELKLWLKENPITVQYELPEPIVKDIVIHNYPHSYEGGHVIIENGDPNTPIPAQLTYRAVTNRSGQIQQHTEQVEKQEREINELETLILANIHLSQTR